MEHHGRHAVLLQRTRRGQRVRDVADKGRAERTRFTNRFVNRRGDLIALRADSFFSSIILRIHPSKSSVSGMRPRIHDSSR